MGSWFSSSAEKEEDDEITNNYPHMAVEAHAQAAFLKKTGRYLNESDYIDDVLRRKIKMDDRKTKQNNRTLKNFLSILIDHLKEIDDLFKSIYHNQPYYTGSFYEGLRVKEANEFDINFILKFPFPSDNILLEYSKVQSFVKYKLKNNNWNNYPDKEKALLTQIEKKFFSEGYLMPSKVREWMQSIMAKVQYKGLPTIENVSYYDFCASGPARTVKLCTFEDEIDIDLVPVILFEYPQWPVGANKSYAKKFNVPTKDQFWFLVPKECTSNVKDANRHWRLHFPEIEKKILHDRAYVKPIIKILKLVRDKQRWKVLASYYIKTVVMWMVIANPDPDYWNKKSVFDKLVEVLKKLRDCVQERRIPYLFYKEFNLLENKLNDNHADNIVNCLNRMIKSIDNDIESLENYI